MRRSKRSAPTSIGQYLRSRTVWGFALIGAGQLIAAKLNHDAGAYVSALGYAIAGVGVKAGLVKAATLRAP